MNTSTMVNLMTPTMMNGPINVVNIIEAKEEKAENPPILEVKNLNVSYRKSGLGRKTLIHVLHDVNFTINEGEIMGLVGESGSGKSTLSKAILGMIKDVDGVIDCRCAGTQMVFQDPIGSLNPSRKIGWIMDESLKLKGGLNKSQRRQVCEEIMEKVGLNAKYLDRYPRELSGGQCQRVAIAMCLIRDPKLIIADEPVSALDVTIQAQILSLLLKLRKDLGLSYLFISHDMDVIWQICDRVMVMKNGRIVEQGTRDEVFDNPQNSYTKQLLDATSADFNPDI